MKRFFIIASIIALTAIAFEISPALADNVLKGPAPETFPAPENCAKCHNVSKIYDELSQSSHDSMSCLECHVPGAAQQDKYKADERTFCRLGYYDGHEKWIETAGNDVCLRCHEDRELEFEGKNCWECHMPVIGVDDFVLVKDKKLPPTGDNIKAHKEFPHSSHVFKVHPETD
ncbi:MAG: hypothetical protein PF482_03105 [Desulfobacteraceae bacterium]|jgi:nitrate/TMAO reductase-like tetraheme cytochrome c subunit|nr:hypothetical protein [Desulfobacteraceae bacterium]